MKNFIPIFIVFFSLNIASGQNTDSTVRLIEVKKIWDKASHNAFTDLIRFNNKFFCVFREGAKHVSSDGALRIITSADGKSWESAALIRSQNSDLRDAKITITPDGQLMLSGAEAFLNKTKNTHQSLAWFSKDGLNWSEKYKIGDPDFWLWRTTWHNNTAYNFGYGCGDNKMLRLYKSVDGKNFDTLVENMEIDNYPNESSIIFQGDTAFCLLRRGGKIKTGLIGFSVPPYSKWDWKDLGVQIGGPHIIQIPDGRLLAAVRLYKDKNQTSLCWINPKTGKLTEALTLPSGGDTSYPGLVWFNNLLWVSYYSSHEDKTAIYLAKVRIENAEKVSKNKVIQKFSNGANQGVAVDKQYFYAISNTQITKHDKTTGELIASWKADLNIPAFQHFQHLNSGTVESGRLYCAHSRYKEDPNNNSIEIWDVKNELLEHVQTIRMPSTHGSLTWIDKHPDGTWWMCYAVYGKQDNKKTRLVKYKYKNRKFEEIKYWNFPKEVIEKWGNMSCSGGSWGPDGFLYTTGHDYASAFVLQVDNQDEFVYVRTENNVGFYGQAIAWDRFSEQPFLWGIEKRKNVSKTLIPAKY